MGACRRLIIVGAVLCAAASLSMAGCLSKRRNDAAPAPPPPDRLAPDEVVEGKERAFGLPLPRMVHVKARFPKTVHVVSPLTPEQLTNFVRARVKDGSVMAGAGKTTLTNVTPLADANRMLTIAVRSLHLGDGTQSEMLVEDSTPPPLEPGLSNEERWEKAGLTPSGKIKDPKHLQ